MKLEHSALDGCSCSEIECEQQATKTLWIARGKVRLCDECFGERRTVVGNRKNKGDVAAQERRRRSRSSLRAIWDSNDLVRPTPGA